MDSNELVARRSDVEIRLFFVYEERVRNPYIFNEFWTDAKRLDFFPLIEGESRIFPELSKVKIQGKVLNGT